MTKDEAIKRLNIWRSDMEFLEAEAWAINFYAETLRDMTAAIRMSASYTEHAHESITDEAVQLTHAMIERLTSD